MFAPGNMAGEMVKGPESSYLIQSKLHIQCKVADMGSSLHESNGCDAGAQAVKQTVEGENDEGEQISGPQPRNECPMQHL